MTDLLTINNLHTHFNLDEGTVRAVDGLDLTIPTGKTVGLVGESGCGKSVAALSVLRLIDSPGRIVDGEIVLHRQKEAVKLTALAEEGREIRAIRGREIAMIFQEPMTAFSPVHSIGSQLQEAATLHLKLKTGEAKAHALRLMERVGIPDAPRRYRQYPHELSGGLRQRAMIAMALACSPRLLIADEPTTALDVTIQAQILALLRELQAEMGMSILLITHDLGVVAEMADEVAVMYLGRVVEHAPVDRLFANPQHPYTRALLQSLPGSSSRKTALQAVTGSLPDPFAQLTGCPFHPRCAEAVKGKCDVGERPAMVEVEDEHAVACLLREAMGVKQ